MDNQDDQTDLALLLQQSDASPHYKDYQPLDRDTKSVRLLHIWRAFDNEIHAKISHASLNDQIEYEALSYCWGPPDIPKRLYIGNEALLIRSTLHAFLEVLCQHKQSLPIWVDSVCINQCDVQERNWQVSMMGDIYRQAARVKSWIGPSDVYSDHVFTYMKYHQNEAFLSSENSARATIKALESLETVLDRPYWKRLWVVQEMALAKELLILCGSRIVSWAHFVGAYDQHLSSHHTLGALGELRNGFFHAKYPPKSPNLRDTPDVFDGPRKELIIPKWSLLAQVSRFSSLLCEDDRDRVFALLSFPYDGDQIDVDYTKSLADVLAEVVLITYNAFLESLKLYALRHPHHKFRGLADCPPDINEEFGWEEFIRYAGVYMTPTPVLRRPQNLLRSLSNVVYHRGIHLRLDRI